MPGDCLTMRMRELESRTGVNRETVRYYIREGLLPEPQREGRTSARYAETHVVRLQAIRRLQDERHLPLAVIKALLNSGDVDSSIAAAAFPALEADLGARLAQRSAARERLIDLATRLNHTLTDLQRLSAVGLFHTQTDEAGIVWVSGSDITIVERTAALRAAGFTEERGFPPEAFRFYLEFVNWLAGEELKLFLTRMAGQVDDAQAVQAAERGIDIMNDILGLVRTRTLLEQLHTVRTTHHNDNR
jgi:DNA-binding transcriptional MerR regulator